MKWAAPRGHGHLDVHVLATGNLYTVNQTQIDNVDRDLGVHALSECGVNLILCNCLLLSG
jgi:hypothetical protein